MKIYDCFMFFDETMMLEIRLNILNKFIDKFIITESKFSHNGKEKKLNFDIKKFSEFKSKIEYIIIDKQPKDILQEDADDSVVRKDEKKIINSLKRENFQREMLSKGLVGLNQNDLVIISDVDEIPNLNNFKFEEVADQIIIFKQKMFYYKLNLYYENFDWFGSKAVIKKNFISPQWLRNIKNKNYSKWRFDTYFSQKKYNNIKFIENGGWHFTCVKSPEEVHKKLLSYLHHQDYESAKMNLDDLKQKMKNKNILYDHNQDKKNNNKWNTDKKLIKINTNFLPEYLIKNTDKYKEWFEN